MIMNECVRMPLQKFDLSCKFFLPRKESDYLFSFRILNLFLVNIVLEFCMISNLCNCVFLSLFKSV